MTPGYPLRDMNQIKSICRALFFSPTPKVPTVENNQPKPSQSTRPLNAKRSIGTQSLDLGTYHAIPAAAADSIYFLFPFPPGSTGFPSAPLP